MENEKRLIDANVFRVQLEEIRQEYLEEDTLSSNFAAEVIETVQDEYLAKAPTVDAVEVVRCKDCKHMSECRGETLCDNPMGIFGRNTADDFCSYGERREGE